MDRVVLAQVGVEGISLEKTLNFVENRLPEIVRVMKQSHPEPISSSPRKNFEFWSSESNVSFCLFFNLGNIRKPTWKERLFSNGFNLIRYFQIRVDPKSNALLIEAQNPTPEMRELAKDIVTRVGSEK